MSNWLSGEAGNQWTAEGSVLWSNRNATDGIDFQGTSTFNQEWVTVANGVGWQLPTTFGAVRVLVAHIDGSRGIDGIRITDISGTQHTVTKQGSHTGRFVSNTWHIIPITAESIDKVDLRMNSGDTIQKNRLVELQVGHI
ncbi:hypothetical protein C440_07522 [Haloferax mucosum ATCC BAA-1512]|uniref:Uncharacterized protein n=1 Tax=Haloferax mucosum ATCC BAA-1512 TaxID=662479 RepID=M0IFR5_9EURY|nr:hypothetical protein [Haloferax mucosum]ELZ94907.1 hypothetical protein C440_07522 [Haloferax mucosum ATCC BAA-1512]